MSKKDYINESHQDDQNDMFDGMAATYRSDSVNGECWAANDLSIDRSVRERWVTLPGGWSVSSFGRVRTKRGAEAHIDITRTGYQRIKPRRPDGTEGWVYLNALVLAVFGETDRADGQLPWHRDSDPLNCRIDNLSWLTPRPIEEIAV